MPGGSFPIHCLGLNQSGMQEVSVDGRVKPCGRENKSAEVMKGCNEEGKPGHTEWRESGGKMEGEGQLRETQLWPQFCG